MTELDPTHRGSPPLRRLAGVAALLLVLLAGVPACRDTPTRTGVFAVDARSPDPQVRGEAALLAGRAGDRKAVSGLIELLMDEEYSVRLNAFFSLNLLIGHRDEFRYEALDPPARRAPAVERYRTFWAERDASGGP